MKLLTKEIIETLKKYPYGSQDGKGGEAIVITKFFSPFSNFTWYVLEWDSSYDKKLGRDEPETLYGIVSGFEIEYGTFSLSELQELANEGKIERDKFFPIGKIKVSEIPELKGII